MLATNHSAEFRSVLEADAQSLEAQVPFQISSSTCPISTRKGQPSCTTSRPRPISVSTTATNWPTPGKTSRRRPANNGRRHARQVLFTDASTYTGWDQISGILSRYQTLSLPGSRRPTTRHLYYLPRFVPEPGTAGVSPTLHRHQPPILTATVRLPRFPAHGYRRHQPCGGFAPEPHFAEAPRCAGAHPSVLHLGDQVVIVSRQAPRMAELWQEFSPPPVPPGPCHPTVSGAHLRPGSEQRRLAVARHRRRSPSAHR